MADQHEKRGELHLVRDVLDKQLVDRHHDPLGRADGIILTFDDDDDNASPPRVVTIESGASTAWARVHPRLGRFASAIGRRIGLRRGVPMRIPWAKLKSVGIELELDLDGHHSAALRWEQWLYERVMRHIPSLKPDKKPSH